MAYLTAGYGTFTSIAQIISLEGFQGLSIGFYLILMCSIAIGVITFLYDESKADALINLSVKVNKNMVNQQMYNQQMNNQSMYSQPMQQPQMQQQSNTGKFDPMTGQPIYYDQNNN